MPGRIVLEPGWDDHRIDRPRPRAGWWRRLLAGAAGNTRLQPGTCCGCTSPTCSIRVCLLCCGGTPYTCGATVTLKNATSGATLASGTSDVTTGCITLDVTTSALLPLIGGQQEATIVVDPTNDSAYATFSATQAVSCVPTSPTTVTLSGAAGSGCCGCTPISGSLTLTDANGSNSFPIYTIGGVRTYAVCYAVSHASVVQSSGINNCKVIITDTIAILYYMTCDIVGGVTGLTIKRFWTSGDYGSPIPNIPAYAKTACTSSSGYPDISKLVCCSTCHDDFSSVFVPLDPCQPFSFSGSLTPDGGNTMPDPVGGTVAIS